jgi:hypothetical protein
MVVLVSFLWFLLINLNFCEQNEIAYTQLHKHKGKHLYVQITVSKLTHKNILLLK